VTSPAPVPAPNPPLNAQHRVPLIYVVDDEVMVLELVQTILKPLGCRIEQFRDGAYALERFRASDQKPDLIVTDYSMPAMNGLELMDACRRIKPGQKLLLMSGTVGEEVFRNRSDMPDSFITKPFDVANFAVAAGRLLS